MRLTGRAVSTTTDLPTAMERTRVMSLLLAAVLLAAVPLAAELLTVDLEVPALCVVPAVGAAGPAAVALASGVNEKQGINETAQKQRVVMPVLVLTVFPREH
jgi:hypothetical protein